MAGSSDVIDSEPTYILGCASCRAPVTVVAGATEFTCGRCQKQSSTLRCERCGGANLLRGSRRTAPTIWNCAWCLTKNTNTALRRLRCNPATAKDTWEAFDHHGLTRTSTATLLGGFEMLHGHGDCPPPNTLCSIAGLDTGILIVAEIGARGRTHIPYHDLLDLQAGGQGTITSNAGMIGGGVGLLGIAKGVALASIINRATMSTRNDSYLRITATGGEMLFSHYKHPPQAVRTGLSQAFVGYLAAQRQPSTPIPLNSLAPPPQPPSPLDELERLTKLHSAGTITDTEFQIARDAQVKALQTGT